MANFDFKPSVLEAVGNGSSVYRWDIKEVENPVQEGETPSTHWESEEVTVWLPLSANKITEAVLTSKFPNNYEAKLVNEYNAAQLGLYDEETAEVKIEAYRSFLNERAALKAQVDADCSELGIK